MKCKKGYEIQLLFSNVRGYTLGTVNENDSTARCIISKEWCIDPEDAELVPYNNQRSDECMACNGNGSCFL